MSQRCWTTLAGMALWLAAGVLPAAQQEQTIFTDADAGVRVICRGDQSEASCFAPRGAPPNGDANYVRVHDQNNLDVGYWHFNLSDVPANAQVDSARFQLDSQTNSWGNTSVMIVAIMDEQQDWDLNNIPEDQIFGGNAPFADWSGWEEGDTNFRRFNNPTPFLDEGFLPAARVRELVETPVFIEDQDPLTEGTQNDPGNSYGGFAGADGPGTAGSADGGANPWPVKNAVDIDITDLIKWKLGQNAAYSTFTPSDRELTIMVRTEFPEAGGDNGFVRFISNESPFLGGELDLEPGRILLTLDVAGLKGDFDGDGDRDINDVNALSTNIATGPPNPATYDLTGDGQVNQADLTAWVKDADAKKTWFGDADLNGEFNTGDLVQIFQLGKFETGQPAGWDAGDWNADLVFTTGDLVAAFQDGGFEMGPRPGGVNVPEPSGIVLAFGLAGLAALAGRRRRV